MFTIINKSLVLVVFFLVFQTSWASGTQISIPAQGHQETILSIQHFGFYALMTQSQQGVALSLVDHMAGPSPFAGVAGKEDGRINQFLDKGQYKIRLRAAEDGEGKLKLTTRPYKELNTTAPRLIEFKWVEQTLGDFQQRSYWLEIKKRKTVHLEAAGRYLSDLRLWHNGNWLVNKQASSQIIEPKSGEPLNMVHLVADLNPGLYLLTAYGGPGTKWSKDSKAIDLYLRYGIPKLAQTGRQHRIASPLGIDRFKIPASANFFQLELPESEAASLLVNSYNEGNPFAEYGRRSDITKKSRLPVAKIKTHSSSSLHLVTVKREANKPYVLQYFESKRRYYVRNQGRHWLSVLHAGHVDDNIPLTPILVRNARKDTLIAARNINLEEKSHLQGQFNLLSPLTLFLNIKETGNYRFSHGSEGAKAEFQLEPFFIHRPRHYRRPGFRPSNESWQVDAGYYVLSIRPRDKGKGILQLTLKGSMPGKRKKLSHNWRFPTVNLSRRSHSVYLNQSDVEQGLILRPYPVSMEQDLPMMLNKGETQALHIRTLERGTLFAKTEDGTALPIEIKGKSKKRHQLAGGEFLISITNTSAGNRFLNLHFQPQRLSRNSELPAISDSLLKSRPNYPVLTGKQAKFFDLGHQQSKVYNIEVTKPGLYRVETSGLLATSGFLRTRLLPALNKTQMIASGRNFLVQEYLRPGLYQIRVQTQGKTQGHLGLHLRNSPVRQGGILQINETARNTLNPGEAIRFAFSIDRLAKYNLRALGLNRHFRMRLEDAETWPLLTPGILANMELELRPGKYFIVILPQALQSRLLTRIEEIRQPAKFEGHGPHHLTLNRQVKHVWMESAKRTPDQWHFSLNADSEVTIKLPLQMRAELLGKGETRILKKLPWSHKLPAGDYRLMTKSHRPNNRLDYHLSINSTPLLSGMQRSIHPPVEIEIANGKHQLVELSSFGEQDVQASLWDEKGNLLAKNDDRQHDWNFLIQKKLPKGNYKLKVQGNRQATLINFHSPKEKDHGKIKFPANLTISAKGVHSFQLPQSNANKLLFAKAYAPHGVGLDVEVLQQGQWKSLGVQINAEKFIAMPLQKGKSYRLRSWSLRSYNVNIQLLVNLIKPKITQEAIARTGLGLQTLSYNDHQFGLSAIKISRHGLFQFNNRESLFWTDGQQTMTALADSSLAVKKGILWVLSKEKSRKITLKRIRLGKAKDVSLSISKGMVHFDLASKQEQIILARSLNGFPALGVAGQAKTAAAFQGSASLLYLPANSRSSAQLWAADGQRGLGVVLEQYGLTSTRPISIGPGVSDFNLKPLHSAQLQTRGVRHVQANLPANSALILLDKKGIKQSFWAYESPRQFLLDLNQKKAILLNLNQDKRQFQILAYTSASGLLDVKYGQPFARLSSASQSYIIPVQNSESAWLQLRGNFHQALFMDKEGRLQRGSNLNIKSGGTLLIHGKPGWFMANIKDSKRDKSSLGKTIRGTSSISLKGKTFAFNISRAEHGMLHLQGQSPVLIEHINPTGKQFFYDYALGANLHLPLVNGKHQVLIHALNHELYGQAQIRISHAQNIAEGLGPRLRLAPGQSRLFKFQVKRQSRVGIGVKSDEDLLNCRLFEKQGKQLGQGVIQLHDLKPDTYYLVIEADHDLKNNIAFQTALVGLKRPSTHAPADVIKHYLKLDKAEVK